MFSLRRGRLGRLVAEWQGAREFEVEVAGAEGEPAGAADGCPASPTRPARALVYPELTPGLGRGDEVWLNTTAVELGLGTGGYHFVAGPAAEVERERSGRGHLIKLRYTPWQVPIWGVGEEGHPGREALLATEERGLEGLPVVAVELHSQIAPVLAGARAAAGRPLRAVYVMTDGGALPIAFSRQVAALRQAGWLAGTVTCGHAFGGDAEAVNPCDGLLAAAALWRPDLVVIGMGPGIVGTKTRFGFSGVEQGWALHVTAALGGRPIPALRCSLADPRPRHRPLSHHTALVLGRLAPPGLAIPVPAWIDEARAGLRGALARAGLHRRHRLVPVDGPLWDQALSEAAGAGLPWWSMGRGPDADPLFFQAAVAAGGLAVTGS